MFDKQRANLDRRSILKSSLAMLAGGVLERDAEAEQPAIKNVNQASSPSTLKITDMRYAVVVKPGPSPCVIVALCGNSRELHGKRALCGGDTQFPRTRESFT